MARQTFGIVALFTATKRGDLNYIRESLAKHGLPRSGPKTTDYLILQTALKRRHEEIAKLLIQNGCRVNHHSSDSGETVIKLAFSLDDEELIQLLIQKGVEFSTNDMLDLCVSKKYDNLLKVLLQSNRIAVNDLKGRGLSLLITLFESPNREEKNIKMIEILVNHGAPFNFKTSKGESVLHLAAKFSDKKLLLFFLQKFFNGGWDVNHSDSAGNTVLHQLLDSTTSQRDKETSKIVKTLLEKGIKADVRNHRGYTAYHIAAKQKLLDTLLILLQFECNLNLINSNGNTIMHELLQNSSSINESSNNKLFEVIKKIPLTDVIIETKNNYHKTVHHLAAENKKKKVLAMLLQSQIAQPGMPDYNGDNVLNIYLQKLKNVSNVDQLDIDLVRKMITKKATVDLSNKYGVSPIHSAFEVNNREILMATLSHLRSIKLKDGRQKTILHYLTDKNLCLNEIERIREAKILLERQGLQEVDFQDMSLKTPLHLAVENKQKEFIKFLLEFGADVDLKDKGNRTPLEVLIESIRSEIEPEGIEIGIAKLLLSKGATVLESHRSKILSQIIAFKNFEILKYFLVYFNQETNESGNTIMHFLLNTKGVISLKQEADIVEIINLLRSKSFNFEIANEEGQTLLHLAARSKNCVISETLLKNGALATTLDKQGNTVLHYLSQLKFDIDDQIGKAMVKKFISLGVSIDTKNNLGKTPLITAAESGSYVVAKILIGFGANLHYAIDNHSLLHIAAENGHFRITCLLSKRGINVDTKRKDGKTALHLACSLKNSQVVKKLLEIGADVDIQDDKGKTALHYACWFSQLENVNHLLDHGADINIVDGYGKTPLIFCQSNKSIKTRLMHYAKKLQMANLPVNDKNQDFVERNGNAEELAVTSTSCLNELLELEKVKIDQHTTYADIIHLSANKLSIYKNNNCFKDTLESKEFQDQFPYYHDIIKACYQRGIVRSKHLEPAVDALRKITDARWPDACCEKVLDYLNNENLRNVTKSVNIKLTCKRKINFADTENYTSAKRMRRSSV